MKIVDLMASLEGVPGALRSAATEIREGTQAADALEKTASRARARLSLRSDEPDDEDDILSALAGEDGFEKIAQRSAPADSLGRASEESASSERLTQDADFLNELRNLGG